MSRTVIFGSPSDSYFAPEAARTRVSVCVLPSSVRVSTSPLTEAATSFAPHWNRAACGGGGFAASAFGSGSNS